MQLLFFSPIPYTQIRQRPQQLVDEFVVRGFSVLFIEMSEWKSFPAKCSIPFFRALGRSIRYHLLAIVGARSLRRRPGKDALGERERKGGVRRLLIPLGIPLNKTSAALINALNRRVYRLFLDSEIKPQLEADAAAIVEHPFWGSVLERNDFPRLCYDCIDDFGVFIGANSKEFYAAAERSLLKNADVTFVTAKELESRLRAVDPNATIVRVPNAVPRSWLGDPSPAQEFPHPVVGYVGYLGPWIDFQLLEAVIRKMPEVHFVFAGPVDDRIGFGSIAELPNVRWLGVVPYTSVPGLIKGLDVCMIPFRQGEIARTTNPVKVYEYFAMGKPVVSTPIRELEEFRTGGILYWAEDASGFLASIRDALTETDQALPAKRRAIAEQNSWHARVDLMLQHMRPSR